jgi:hypothetical protein
LKTADSWAKPSKATTGDAMNSQKSKMTVLALISSHIPNGIIENRVL